MTIKEPTYKEIEPFFDDFIFKNDIKRENMILQRLVQALQFYIKELKEEHDTTHNT